MSDRINEIFLLDIYVALLKIEETATNFQEADALKHDFKSWDCVIREFEIIGEAMKHLLETQILPEDYRVIIDFRNLLAHHYFGIDEEEIWDVIMNDLPPLKKDIIIAIRSIEANLKEKLITSTQKQNHYLPFIIDGLSEI